MVELKPPLWTKLAKIYDNVYTNTIETTCVNLQNITKHTYTFCVSEDL